MIRGPPSTTRTDPLLPDTTLCRSAGVGAGRRSNHRSGSGRARGPRPAARSRGGAARRARARPARGPRTVSRDNRRRQARGPSPRRPWETRGGPARAGEIGRAHVCTPVTNALLVCRLLLFIIIFLFFLSIFFCFLFYL